MSTEGAPRATAGWYPDPAYNGMFRFWDGKAWTEHRSKTIEKAPESKPELITPPIVQRRPASPLRPTGKVDNAVAWTLAFAPLLGLVLTYVLIVNGLDSDIAWWSGLALNVVLAFWDEHKLDAVGVEPPSALWALLVPVYLFMRARLVPGTTAIPIVWCVTFLLSMAVPIY